MGPDHIRKILRPHPGAASWTRGRSCPLRHSLHPTPTNLPAPLRAPRPPGRVQPPGAPGPGCSAQPPTLPARAAQPIPSHAVFRAHPTSGRARPPQTFLKPFPPFWPPSNTFDPRSHVEENPGARRRGTANYLGAGRGSRGQVGQGSQNIRLRNRENL